VALTTNRREFLRDLGISAGALPFLLNLPSLGFANQQKRKQRLVVMFSPNGVIPSAFWPDEEGKDFKLKESLKPLEPFQSRTLFLHGVCDKVRGDGDKHMRGMGCLLTEIELFPGNNAGPNKPIAPIDNPYQMFSKLYGRVKDRESLRSILDDIDTDLGKLRSAVSTEDQQLLEEHATFVREMEQELKKAGKDPIGHAVPEIEPA